VEVIVFLVFSRAVCCVRVAAQAQAQAPRVLVCCAFRGWDALAACCCFQLLLLHQHTATHSATTKAAIAFALSHHEQSIHTIAPPSFVAFTFTDLLNKSWDPTQGHGVFGLVDSTDKTVGDTARHCDQGLLSFSLFPGSVCEHYLFLFCTLASVRIDHGTRADKRVGWDDGSLCSGAFSLTCTYSDKL
jgi:hypothetical protein